MKSTVGLVVLRPRSPHEIKSLFLNLAPAYEALLALAALKRWPPSLPLSRQIQKPLDK
jgi:hypothetical protein